MASSCSRQSPRATSLPLGSTTPLASGLLIRVNQTTTRSRSVPTVTRTQQSLAGTVCSQSRNERSIPAPRQALGQQVSAQDRELTSQVYSQTSGSHCFLEASSTTYIPRSPCSSPVQVPLPRNNSSPPFSRRRHSPRRHQHRISHVLDNVSVVFNSIRDPGSLTSTISRRPVPLATPARMYMC